MAINSAISVPAGGFTRTCRNLSLEFNVLLHAECRRSNQRDYAETFINLNEFIANIDGKLLWIRGGNYGASSQNCHLDGVGNATFLECTTHRNDGSPINSEIRLDTAITNVDGNLRYQPPTRIEL